MRFKGAVLVRAAVKPGMGCNTVAFKEDFNRASGHTHVDFLLDVLIRARVVLCIHTDVVIVLNCGNFPGSVDTTPTVPSTAALSFGVLGRAGMIAVP